MKKIIFILVLLLVIESVFAQNIELSLISYDSQSHKAKIRIENIGNSDLHDLSLQIDNLPALEFPGSLLKSGTAIILTKNVLPEKHKVKVTTKEGIIIEKEITFSKTEADRKEDLAREREIKTEKIREQRKTSQTQEETKIEEPQESGIKTLMKKWYIIIIAIGLLFIFLFFVIKHYLKKRITPLPIKTPLIQGAIKKPTYIRKIMPISMRQSIRQQKPIITRKELGKAKQRNKIFEVFGKKEEKEQKKEKKAPLKRITKKEEKIELAKTQKKSEIITKKHEDIFKELSERLKSKPLAKKEETLRKLSEFLKSTPPAKKEERLNELSQLIKKPKSSTKDEEIFTKLSRITVKGKK
jgi:hypothetical protein